MPLRKEYSKSLAIVIPINDEPSTVLARKGGVVALDLLRKR